MLQNTWLILFQNGKVRKDKEKVKKYHRLEETEKTRQLKLSGVVWDHEKDMREKIGNSHTFPRLAHNVMSVGMTCICTLDHGHVRVSLVTGDTCLRIH